MRRAAANRAGKPMLVGDAVFTSGAVLVNAPALEEFRNGFLSGWMEAGASRAIVSKSRKGDFPS